jgi:hypothetical protein
MQQHRPSLSRATRQVDHFAGLGAQQGGEGVDAALKLGEFAAQTRVASTSRTAVPRGSPNGEVSI